MSIEKHVSLIDSARCVVSCIELLEQRQAPRNFCHATLFHLTTMCITVLWGKKKPWRPFNCLSSTSPTLITTHLALSIKLTI